MNLDDVREFAALGAVVVEGLHRGTVKIGGVEYAAAVGQDPLAVSSRRGGEFFEGDLLVQIRKDVLAEKPVRKTVVEEVKTDGKVIGAVWTVSEVKGDEAVAVVWSLHLEPKN